MVDEKPALVLIALRKLRDGITVLVTAQLVEMQQGQRMGADGVVDYKLHPSKPHPVDWQPPPAGRGRRVCEVEHDPGAGFGNMAEFQRLDREVGMPGIDQPLVAARAIHCHLLLVMQDMGGVTGADDGGHAQLAADDGGVAGASAGIGDNRAGALHDRHPVGVGLGGHENRAVDKPVDVLDLLDQADCARCHCGPDRKPLDQHFAVAFDVEAFHRSHLGPALNRLGPGLNDVKLARQPVAGPFHVHRQAVMLFDDGGHAGECEDFGV